MKIGVVSPYFPVSGDAARGHSAYQTLLLLKNVAEIEVNCPLSTYPRLKWLTPKRLRNSEPPDLNFQPGGVHVTYMEYPAIPVVTRPINGLVCARRLEPWVKAVKPDILLNYWLYPEGFSAALVGRKLGIPVIVGSIGSDMLVPADALTLRLTVRAMRMADGVLTVSEGLRQRAIALGIAPEKVTKVFNGCDTAIFRPGDRAAARTKLGIAADAELVVYVGRLVATKGLGELVDAVASLAASHPRLKVALIGEGPYASEMKAKIAGAGLHDHFLFAGKLTSTQIADWLVAGDLFCLPSYSEGCPNVVLEALSCGAPVLATNVGGIPELVDQSNGVLVAARDSAMLADGLARALGTTWDRAAISARLGRSWQTVADETYEFCSRVLRERQAR